MTGGAGFIGSAVVRYLIQTLDAEVICVDSLSYSSNKESLRSVFKNNLFNFEKEDISSRLGIERVLNTHCPDKILHLAAETHVDRSIDNPDAFIQTNILGTFNLLNVCLEYWKSLNASKKANFKFHHVSTDEVFGELERKQKPFNELSSYNPSSPYSASKASSDHLVKAWYKTYQLPILMSNCSNNYGPYQFPEKLIPLTILKALEGSDIPIYGSGDQIRDWIYVEDHVEALVKILNNAEVGETYNIGGNCERTNLDVVKTICNALEKLQPKHSQGISKYSDLISFVEDRPGHDYRYAIDNKKIERDFKWRPKESLETGVLKTVSWYLESKDWLSKVQKRYEGERLGLKE